MKRLTFSEFAPVVHDSRSFESGIACAVAVLCILAVLLAAIVQVAS